MSGKAPYAVARAAQARGIPVVAIAGSIALSDDEVELAGIEKAVAIAPATMLVDEAMRRARELIESAAFQLAGSLAK